MENESIKLYGVHFDQCDRKKCSCLKLKKFNLINIVKQVRNLPRSTIILDPFAERIISFSDREKIQKYGLAIIDCSWVNAETIFRRHFRTGRRLPKLLAANNVNYGRWDKLNSVEALAAGLILTGYDKTAAKILSKFKWGDTFININQNLRFEN